VSECALVIGIIQFALGDAVFGVTWWIWAVLWFFFFLLLGQGTESLARSTGWFAILIGHLTAIIPALFCCRTATSQTRHWPSAWQPLAGSPS